MGTNRERNQSKMVQERGRTTGYGSPGRSTVSIQYQYSNGGMIPEGKEEEEGRYRNPWIGSLNERVFRWETRTFRRIASSERVCHPREREEETGPSEIHPIISNNNFPGVLDQFGFTVFPIKILKITQFNLLIENCLGIIYHLMIQYVSNWYISTYVFPWQYRKYPFHYPLNIPIHSIITHINRHG